jgi:hypothetical protein
VAASGKVARDGGRIGNLHGEDCGFSGILSLGQAKSAEPNSFNEKDQVHMITRIVLDSGVNGFAENKETARAIRLGQLLPALDNGDDVVIDFAAVRYATQSFVHALIGEGLQKYGEEFLERVEFKNCSPQLQSVIELVVDYSLSGFPTVQSAYSGFRLNE